MAEQPSGGGRNLGAILGWGSLALATVGFIWFVATQLAVTWAGREKEALELARAYKAPGMQFKLDDHKIQVQNEARQKGEFVGTFSWATVQAEGPVYKVSLTWMEGSQHKKATWNVDLKAKSVEAADPAATEFMKRGTGSPGS